MNRFARLVAAGLMTMAAPVAALPLLAVAAVPAAAQAPTDAQIAVAREMVRASGLARSFEAVIPGMFEQVRAQLVTRPEIKNDVEEIIVKITPEINARADDMVTVAARVFAAQIPQADLEQIAAFFKSPAGQRYVQAQPAVMQELVTRMDDWSSSLSGVIIERIRNELTARGKTF